MRIGNTTSMNSMSGIYMTSAASAGPKIKNIQNKIASVQQEMQKLSSKGELSITEKTDKRKKLQKEVSSLNTVLKQRQEELRKSQKRELMMAQLQEDAKPAKKDASKDTIQTNGTSSDNSNEKALPADKQQAGRPGTVLVRNSDGSVILKDKMRQDNNRGIDTEKEQDRETGEENISETETKPADNDTAKDTGLSGKETHAIVSADSSIQQANRQGTVIAQTRDGIVILKGEMNQDEIRGLNTERKQEEIEKMEKREQIASAFQFSVLGEANNRMKSALETKMPGMKDRPQVTAINNAFLNAVKTSQEERQAAQQNFYVSFR
ncbi:MAG: hypothetical protein HFH49_14850 [Lachnospiraceae bacterium]|nr:hypothetical protein [Lachnospiraceae bacterium]